MDLRRLWQQFDEANLARDEAAQIASAAPTPGNSERLRIANKRCNGLAMQILEATHGTGQGTGEAGVGQAVA